MSDARLAQTAAPRRSASLANLQLLRAVAAGSVLVYHSFVYLESVRGVPRLDARADSVLGLAGVAIFFAISGFLMARLVTQTGAWTFLTHRIVRIFPPFLGAVALFAAIFAAVRLPFSINPVALTLAPVGARTYPLNVEWTLIFETSFYVGLFLVSWVGLAARIVPLAAAWLAILAAALLLLPDALRDATLPPLYLLPFSSANVAFVGGLLLPRLIAAGLVRPILGWLAVPLYVACIWLGLDEARWAAGIASALLVGAVVQVRQVSSARPLSRAALALGDWSYVLYLVHVPTILLVLAFAPAGWPGGIVWAVEIMAALAMAAALGPLDIGLYRMLRRRLDAASTRARRSLALAYLGMFVGISTWGGVAVAREAWRESKARTALAGLPPEALGSSAALETFAAGHAIALPGTVHGAIDGIDPVSGTASILGAWAFDEATPQAEFLIAVYCRGRLVRLDGPQRLRPDVARRPGLDASKGRRIGYRVRLERADCTADDVVPILVGAGGRMAGLLRAPAQR